LATALHHISTTDERSALDLIFVHGIGGDPATTWTDGPASQSWLHWLDEDHPDFNVYSLEYESSASEWLGPESMPIYDRANNLLELLASNNVGQRPIIFVGHSLGGLLIKKILQNAEDSGVKRYREIFDQTKGVVFIATPHQGSARVPTSCRTI
jgi:pimeloyl-ACP methyl ester carboxylesterase